MSRQPRGIRTGLGAGLTTSFGAIGIVHLWDRDWGEVLLAAVFVAIGVYLLVTGRRRDKDSAASETSAPKP
jgi:uncharacterized membrane protein YfcA